MTKTIITLTVPYEGRDRSISGTPVAIAKAALFVEMGLPTLEQQNCSLELANMCDDSSGETSMGMGNGAGDEFITGSHTLIGAIRAAMDRAQPERSVKVMSLGSKPWGTDQRRIVAHIAG